MRRFSLFLSTLLFLFYVGVLVYAKLPSRPESIKPLMSGDSAGCTTWSVNEAKGWWVTAGHCVVQQVETEEGLVMMATPDLNIGGKPITAARVDLVNDLALLEADIHMPALKYGNYPNVGDAVTVYGYPGGWLAPFPTWLTVSNPFAKLFNREWMVLDGSVWPGHSGSPVLDRKGHVVGVIQAHGTDRYAGTTFACTWQQLGAFVADSWGH